MVWKHWGIKTGLSLGASFMAMNCAVAAPSLQDQLDELDQKLKVLQRQMEIKNDEAAAKAKAPGSVTASYDSKGFVLKTGDGNNEFRVNALAQFDSRWYPGAHPNAANLNGATNTQTGEISTFTVRRVRLIFTGTVGKIYSYYLQPSFDGGGAGLQDAWVNAAFKPYFQIRAGKFKLPFGLERLQSSGNNSLVESGFTTWLTPNYDNGVQVLGTVATGVNALDYQFAFTNGSNENQSDDSDANGNKQWTIRVFDQPFKNSDKALLQNLGVGFAYSRGGAPRTVTLAQSGGVSSTVNNGAVAGNQVLVPAYNNLVPGLGQYANFGTNGLLKPGSDIVRYSPQAYYYGGPFGLLAEYVNVQKTMYTAAQTVAGAQDIKNNAWQVIGTYVLTGETPTYNSGITPKKAFLKDGGIGAIELVVRYQVLNIDNDSFHNANGTGVTGVLSRATAISQARGIGVDLNWYLAKNVKLMLDFDHFGYTDGGGGTAANPLDRKSDKTIFTRAQVAF